MVLCRTTATQLEHWGAGIVRTASRGHGAGEPRVSDQLGDGLGVVVSPAIWIREATDGLAQDLLDGGLGAVNFLPRAVRGEPRQDGVGDGMIPTRPCAAAGTSDDLRAGASTMVIFTPIATFFIK